MNLVIPNFQLPLINILYTSELFSQEHLINLDCSFILVPHCLSWHVHILLVSLSFCDVTKSTKAMMSHTSICLKNPWSQTFNWALNLYSFLLSMTVQRLKFYCFPYCYRCGIRQFLLKTLLGWLTDTNLVSFLLSRVIAIGIWQMMEKSYPCLTKKVYGDNIVVFLMPSWIA